MPDYSKDIVRVENPDPDTEERNEMADIIEEMWPATPEEMAENSPYSHGHVRNTLESHFEFVEPEPECEHDAEIVDEIQIPEGVDRKSYLRGMLDGLEAI